MDVRAGLPSTKFVEFIGTVVEPGVLKEDSSTDWGENFGEGMHGRVVPRPSYREPTWASMGGCSSTQSCKGDATRFVLCHPTPC
eukprot:179286-Chlamydomonas_euryale.AAC.6